MLEELSIFKYIEDNGVECPAGLAFHELHTVTKQLLISNCMYENDTDRYEAIEHLESFSYDSEGNTMGYL